MAFFLQNLFKMDASEELRNVIAVFFNVSVDNILLESNASTIPDWDSFNHMELMTKIESHFDIRIPLEEIIDFTNVGDILHYISSIK